MKNKTKNELNPSRRLFWSLAFILIAALSVWAVTANAKDFSLERFWEFVKNANLPWIIAAVLSMLCFIIFEGLALLYICRSFGYKRGFKDGFLYSGADIYFSAITPSATGGQPASAVFMMKDGIPGMFVTVALVANLTMYTASLVFVGLFAVLVSPGLFLNFGLASKLLILIGLAVQSVLLIFIILLLFKKGVMHGMCKCVLKLLCKLHIIKNPDEKFKYLKEKMDEYSDNAAHLSGKGKMLFVVFLLNLVQRIAQIAVPAFTHLASGGSFSEAVDVFIAQIYVTVGAYSVPIPGAIGVTDYLMIDTYTGLGIENPAFLELFSRSLSFYVCVFICGITVLCGWISRRKKEK